MLQTECQSVPNEESPMHSRKSRRALDLDLRTNSLESRQLLATPTPTATVAIFCRSTNLTKTGLYLGAQQYVVWPSNPRFATVTLTKPLTVHQAAGFTFTTTTSYAPPPPFPPPDRSTGHRVFPHNPSFLCPPPPRDDAGTDAINAHYQRGLQWL